MTSSERIESLSSLPGEVKNYARLLLGEEESLDGACWEFFGKDPEALFYRIDLKPEEDRESWEKQVLKEGLPLQEKDRAYIAEVASSISEGLGLRVERSAKAVKVFDGEGQFLTGFSYYKRNKLSEFRWELYTPWQDGEKRPLTYVKKNLASPKKPTNERQEIVFPQTVAARTLSKYAERYQKQPLEEGKRKIEQAMREMEDPAGAFYLAYYFVTNGIRRLQLQRDKHTQRVEDQALLRWHGWEYTLFNRFMDDHYGSPPRRLLQAWHKAVRREEFNDWFSPSVLAEIVNNAEFHQLFNGEREPEWGVVDEGRLTRRAFQKKFADLPLAEIISWFEYDGRQDQLKEAMEKSGLPLMERDFDAIAVTLQNNVDLEQAGLDIEKKADKLRVRDAATGKIKLTVSRYSGVSFCDEDMMVAGDILPFSKKVGIEEDMVEKTLLRFWQGVFAGRSIEPTDLEEYFPAAATPGGFASLLKTFLLEKDQPVPPAVFRRVDMKLEDFQNKDRPGREQLLDYMRQNGGLNQWLFWQARDPEHFTAFMEAVESDSGVADHFAETVCFIFGKNPEEVVEELRAMPEKQLSEQQRKVLQEGFGVENSDEEDNTV